MGINKNFVIKNGLEVDENLLYVDYIEDKVGIKTAIPNYELEVIGGIGAKTLNVGVGGTVLSSSSSTGRTGIGTTEPTQRLQVQGNAVITSSLYVGSATNSSLQIINAGQDIFRPNGRILLRGGGGQSTRNSIELTNNTGIVIDGGSGETYGVEIKGGGGPVKVTQGNFLVGTSAATGTASQLLQVNSGAYISSLVGIGITEPTSKLHVVGDAKVTGVVTATSFSGDGSNLTGINAGIGSTSNINTTGIITAASFSGDGSNLTGINAGIGSTSNINTTGIITAASFSGDVTGNADTATTATYATTAGIATYATTAGIATYTSEWILGANGTSDFTFTGPGFTGAENDPTLYLTRGQQYKFTNNSGGSHPFRIQSTPNGSTGTQYNDGITNNDTATGTLTWDVQFDAPDTLYYQCTNHSAMGGKIYILNAGISTDSSINTTGIITATSFVGDLTGNVTGIASTATTVTVADESSDTTCFPVFTIDATGNLAPKTDASALTYDASTGTLTATNLNSTSDINLKKDIEVITNATELLNQVRGVKFTWKGTDTKSTGVIAQEVESVLPELISRRSDNGDKSVNYNGLVGVLIEAVKELSARVEELEK